MRTKILIMVLAGVLMIGSNLYAGDLSVSGNVGIGTTTPSAKLAVELPYNGWNGYEPIIKLSAWQTGENSNGGAIDFYVNNTAYSYPTSRIIHTMSGGVGGELQFATNDNFLTNMPTPRVVIKPNGAVGIGTMYPSYMLHVNGTTYSAGGYAGSDIRWKKNIMPIENSLENVLKLQGVNFEWRVDEYKYKNFSEGKQIGLIAQEVEKVIPELVHADNEGYKAVSYEKLTAVLIEAIKEQQKKIAELENRLKMLEK